MLAQSQAGGGRGGTAAAQGPRTMWQARDAAGAGRPGRRSSHGGHLARSGDTKFPPPPFKERGKRGKKTKNPAAQPSIAAQVTEGEPEREEGSWNGGG